MNATLEFLTSLIVHRPFSATQQPVTFGLPFPRGRWSEIGFLGLRVSDRELIPAQGHVLARWPDKSIRWALVDAILPQLPDCGAVVDLVRSHSPLNGPRCQVDVNSHALSVDSGTIECKLEALNKNGWLAINTHGRSILERKDARWILTDQRGREFEPVFEQLQVEHAGPIRVTARLQGRFPVLPQLRLKVRISFFAGTGLVFIRSTLHNAQRARHKHGLWDLGDPGSILFRDLSMRFAIEKAQETLITWIETPGQYRGNSTKGPFEIYQDSSGGENWQSRNHVNRFGQVPCRFRGFRVQSPERESSGERALPVATMCNGLAHITAAIIEFWQQFPKAIDSANGCLNLRLFPQQFGDLFELQGGEQKSHDTWFHFGPGQPDLGLLEWVHNPGQLRATPEWHQSTDVFPEFVTGTSKANNRDRFDSYVQSVIDGQDSLFSKREVIDEYGWRNYGDIYADHENAYYPGPKPVISHYNNQFDILFGCIWQFVRTGDSRWQDLYLPLARHVIDIDIYHTELDRPAYRGGLFWMTDHYFDAGTSTHRTYSRSNKKPGRPYGGGPGNAHNFTTGLLFYYYFTGDVDAADAVVGLADWVQRMDDGRQSVLARIDPGPTGLASCTTDMNYHGPGRGAGLSINSQLDAWMLTGRRAYLSKAEELIRRCVHPADDIADRNLLDIELRWSYTVFLSSLARYLRLKWDEGEIDIMYAYSRAALLHYAQWMADHEQPNFEKRDQMEFPTESWAAQDFRKANVMRSAAYFADEPLRTKLMTRGDWLAERAWADLLAFQTSHVTRAVAIMLTEGTRDQFFRTESIRAAPKFEGESDFGAPNVFHGQRQRVRSLLRTPAGWLTLFRRLMFGSRNL